MRFKPFEELFEIPLRNGLTKPKRVRGEGYKMVNMGELFKYPRIKNIPMDRVPLNDKECASSMLMPGDLLFARQSLVLEGAGQCSVFVGDDEEVCFESHLIRCRLNKNIANPLFYYYFFSSQTGKQTIRTIVEQGAGASGIRGSDLAKLLVPELGIEVQNAIAFVLNQIDSKIEANQQINQTLEQMAQAIFKSWFVDFEPVKAKIAALEAGGSEDDALLAAMQAIAGSALFATDAADTDAQTQLARLQAEHPEQYATLRATAELFPSEMQESELGGIPQGWEVTLSGRVIDVRDGTHDSPKRAEEGFPLVTSKHITSGELKIEDAYLISKLDFDSVNKRSKVDDGDILLTMIGTVGIPFYVNQADVEFAIKNVGLFKTSSNRNLGAFFYLLLKSEKMQSYLDARIAGTTQKYLSLTTLRTLEFVLPHEQVLHYFSTLTAPIFNQIEQLIQQNTYLSNTRDTLLPKLLSGELSLAAAEEQLTYAVEPADV